MRPGVGGWGGAGGPGADKGMVLTHSDWLCPAGPGGARPGQREEEAGGELGPAPTAGRQRRGGRKEGGKGQPCLSRTVPTWVRNKKGPEVDVGEGGCQSQCQPLAGPSPLSPARAGLPSGCCRANVGSL